MTRSLAVLLILAAVGAATLAEAKSPEILRRLMGEPLTLFDWGLVQLERDLERASLRLAAERPTRAPPRSSAIYDWRQGLVLMSLAVEMPTARRTRPECTALFHRVVGELTGNAPESPDAAGWYLQNAFQPKAHFFAGRFEDIGAKLLEVVRLEVALRAPTHEAVAGDSRQVVCSGRLDADPEAMSVELKS